jgi:hypothetical protein
MASKGTLVAGEPDTYTATVTPKTGGGEAPTGTVFFYDNGAPIPGCTAISLTANGASAIAGCNATPEEGTEAITATYSGDSSYTQSEALAITVTVTSRSTAEEEAAKKRAEEESAAKKKAEQEAAAKKKAEEEAAAKKNAEQEAAAKKRAEEEAAAKKKGEEAAAGALAGWLAPHGKLAKIGAVLKHGGYTLTVTAPTAGVLAISWYRVPTGAHLSGRKPVLIASGVVSITASRSMKITVRLTSAGKRLLKKGRPVKLTARGTFTPTAGTPIVRLKTFTLSR